ncbi:MAG: Hsp20/alpha crystallin family protein [Lentisphaeria bacterium]|nr:Hsp20/alpha crystallin family protein [Lentisphaeria bacterium]
MTMNKLAKRQQEAVEKADETLVFVPRVDIVENEHEILLRADMPGVTAESVDIALEGQELTITGRCQTQAPEGYELAFGEYQNGNYEREFTLGDSIDRGNIKAAVKDGVLSLTLPKAKESKPRRITVKAG